MFRRAALNTSNRRIKGTAAAAAAFHRPSASVGILQRQRGRPALAPQCSLEPGYAYFGRTGAASRDGSTGTSSSSTRETSSAIHSSAVATTSPARSGVGSGGAVESTAVDGGRSFKTSQGSLLSEIGHRSSSSSSSSSSNVDNNTRTTKAPASTAAATAGAATARTPTAARAATTTTAAAAAAAAGPSSALGVAEVSVDGDGDGDSDRRFHAPDANLGGKFVVEPRPPQTTEVKAWRRAEALLALVLPSGFPASVRFPYGEYAAWHFVGMVASAAAGVMSTQSLLYAMGLGAGSIPLAATLNWVIKDGLGQLGGVAFSSLVNTRFDSNPKLWRIVAAVSLDASMVLELLAPLAPAYFLAVASVANIGKNVSFLAASASRVAIHNVLSAKGNLADVTAKSGAQTILACTVGTGVGIAFSTLLGSEWQALFPACLCLSAVHLGANYLSIRRVGIPTFDSQRLELVMEAVHANQAVLTPGDVPAQEHILMHTFRGQLGLDRAPAVNVGSRLEEAVSDWGELEGLCRACHGLPFLLAVRGDVASRSAEVHVLLLEGCTARDVLAGSYVAHLAKRLLLDRELRRPRQRGALGRFGDKKPAPAGEILYDVIEEALRQGTRYVAPSPSSGSAEAEAEAFPQGGREGSRKVREPEVAGDFVLAAEQSGWDTSVQFLERPGAMRLRLVRPASDPKYTTSRMPLWMMSLAHSLHGNSAT